MVRHLAEFPDQLGVPVRIEVSCVGEHACEPCDCPSASDGERANQTGFGFNLPRIGILQTEFSNRHFTIDGRLVGTSRAEATALMRNGPVPLSHGAAVITTMA